MFACCSYHLSLLQVGHQCHGRVALDAHHHPKALQLDASIFQSLCRCALHCAPCGEVYESILPAPLNRDPSWPLLTVSLAVPAADVSGRSAPAC